jgi:DNA polymerase-3 subunit alpha
VWTTTKHLWQPERILVVSGKVDTGRRDTPSLLCGWVKTPDEVAVPSDQNLPQAVAPPPPRSAETPTPKTVVPPVRTVRVTLTRSGEQTQDVQTLRKVHSLLVDHSGQDQFIIHLAGGTGKPVELAFPNDTTRYCPELKQKLAAIVGAEAVRVKETAQ